MQVIRSTRPTDGDGVPSTVRTATLSTGRPNSAEASSDLIRSSHVSGSRFPASRVGGAPADVVGAAPKDGTGTTTGADEQAVTPATTAAPHTARASHAGPVRRPCRIRRGSPTASAQCRPAPPSTRAPLNLRHHVPPTGTCPDFDRR